MNVNATLLLIKTLTQVPLHQNGEYTYILSTQTSTHMLSVINNNKGLREHTFSLSLESPKQRYSMINNYNKDSYNCTDTVISKNKSPDVAVSRPTSFIHPTFPSHEDVLAEP